MPAAPGLTCCMLEWTVCGLCGGGYIIELCVPAPIVWRAALSAFELPEGFRRFQSKKAIMASKTTPAAPPTAPPIIAPLSLLEELLPGFDLESSEVSLSLALESSSEESVDPAAMLMVVVVVDVTVVSAAM